MRRREVPLVVMVGGVIVDGQADLLCFDGDCWMVVDFKTDIDLRTGVEPFRRQVALYLETLRRATGRAAVGMLLRA